MPVWEYVQQPIAWHAMYATRSRALAAVQRHQAREQEREGRLRSRGLLP